MKGLELNFEQALNLTEEKIFIDLRSPGEYNEGTIPGAINIPLFSDSEREEIGTIYHHNSPREARFKALEIVSPKLPEIIRRIEMERKGKLPVLFCWRGGMRSMSICSVLEILQLPYVRLLGGYKGFRRYVINYLRNYKLPGPLVVLHGYTGVGKTMIIRHLIDLGLPVIDLEELAGHRGSAFGAIGLKEPPGQKIFDAALWLELQKFEDADCLIIEAESKRIGKVTLPDFLLDKREEGINIIVKAPLEKRVENLVMEYKKHQNSSEFKAACEGALKKIKNRLVRRNGKEGFERALSSIREGNWNYLAGFLLENYYDPLYRHSQKKYPDFDLEVQAFDTREAAKKIFSFLKNEKGLFR